MKLLEEDRRRHPQYSDMDIPVVVVNAKYPLSNNEYSTWSKTYYIVIPTLMLDGKNEYRGMLYVQWINGLVLLFLPGVFRGVSQEFFHTLQNKT